MYLLDTNVISELRRGKSLRADQRVLAWAESVPASELYISAITVLELEIGVLLAERRDSAQGKLLRSWLSTRVLSAFSDRVLPVDAAVAQQCANLHVPDPRSDRDALIAATAIVHGMSVVSRNVRAFDHAGVKPLNPWEYEL